MIQHWFVPSFWGDLRLSAETPSLTCLSVQGATPAELVQVQQFLTAVPREWLHVHVKLDSVQPNRKVRLKAPLAEVGPVFARVVGLAELPGRLTAIVSQNGVVTVSEQLEQVQKAALRPDALAAATVRRATPCCPDAWRERERRASEVLKAFCSREQWLSWLEHGHLVAAGSHTGHRYRLCHPNSVLAVRQTRICYDLDDRGVLHFHDSLLPGPEQVLGAKLVLEHREPWLRNHSTCLGGFRDVFVNPLGHRTLDGVIDARLTEGIGGVVRGMVGLGARVPEIVSRVSLR